MSKGGYDDHGAGVKQAEVAQQELDFNKQQWAELSPYLHDMLASSEKNNDTDTQMKQQQMDIAKRYDQEDQRYGAPIRQQIYDEAQQAGGESDRQAAMQSAIGDTTRALDQQRAATARDQASMGVNPNSGRAQALAAEQDVGGAAIKAAAATRANQVAKQLGWAKKADAANVARGGMGTQASATGLALNAGQSGLQGMNGAMGSYQGAMNSMNQGFNGAGNNFYGAGMQFAKQQEMQNQADAGFGQMVGTAIGTYAKFGMPSSKDFKENNAPVDGNQVLSALKNVPVDSWKYKDGVADGSDHIGPYAEDVHAQFGDAAAPGGKMLDPVTMNGINMAAIKALNDKVDALSAKKQPKAAISRKRG